MKASDVRVCVVRIEGTNCEGEMAEAFRTVGAQAEEVHLKQLEGRCAPELGRSLEDYDILAIPGGFSAGDYVRAGALFAARMKASLRSDLVRFVENGNPVLGVCNGFQVLVELGLLPAFDSTMSEEPQAALYTNDSGRFECRPTVLRNDNRGKCVFVSDIGTGEAIYSPSAHAEGKFMCDVPDFLAKLEEHDQVVFRYASPEGDRVLYPWNPNGSPSNIAGICNPAGNVMGMMPHPERAMTAYTVADWARGHASEDGDGRKIFTSVMKYMAKRRSDADLHIDAVAGIEAQRPAQVVLAYDLDHVDVMGPLRHDDGAVQVADPRFVGDDVTEAATVVREAVDEDAGGGADHVEFADVLLVDDDVEGALERPESELLLELLGIPLLRDVVPPLAHAVLHRAVDDDVVAEFEYAAVLVVFAFEFVDPLLRDFDLLLAGAEVAHDQAILEKFEDPLGRRLLAHLEGIPELLGGNGSVIVHGAQQGELPHGGGVLFVHGAQSISALK